MKTKILFLLLIIFLIVITFFSACKDAIFYHISQEIEIVPPMIEGSPTNIELFNGRVYVASGKKLFSYRKTDISGERNWRTEKSPGIYIGQLAATENYLYALCYDDNSAVIKRLDTSRQWEDVLKNVDNTEYRKIQKIYSANNKLYIGAQKSNENDYAVHVMTSNGVFEERDFITGISKSSLMGACFNGTDVFLCTGSGIYINDNDDPIENSGKDFNGIITLDDSTVVAITRKGSLFMVETAKLVDDPDNAGQQIEQPAVTKITNFSDGRYTTGAIALWQENASSANWLLLVGRTEIEYSTSTGHSYGYMELELSQTGGLDSEKTFTEPGKSDITTVQGYESYSSSMGAIPINSIYHVPIDIDDEMRIFASTQKDGVWSCKPVKSGGYGWNAETKN